MNKFLSQALSVVNSFLAFFIIIGSGFIAMFSVRENEGLAFLVGISGGLIVAILVCGTLALLLNIRDEIVLANKSLNDLNKEQK